MKHGMIINAALIAALQLDLYEGLARVCQRN